MTVEVEEGNDLSDTIENPILVKGIFDFIEKFI